jgi:SAM-dependent methyltransferase
MDYANVDEVHQAVRDRYAQAADGAGCSASSCCCGSTADTGEISERVGYSAEDLSAAPAESNLGLGCGNPTALASLKPGETVLDLGSGAGLDCFLAARAVGDTGRVIGIDMTPEMLSKARQHARAHGYANVEFRLGEIESLPAADDSVDVILSNCVINLSPDKPRVFGEAFRVLKPGGRLAISDVVALAPLPDDLRSDMSLFTGCSAGAATVGELEKLLTAAGFERIAIQVHARSREFIRDWAPGRGIEDYVASATIEAVKPRTPA